MRAVFGKKLNDSKTDQGVNGDWQPLMNEIHFSPRSFWNINGLDQHWHLKMANLF